MGFDLLSRFRKRGADDPPQVESWPLHAFGKLPVYKDFISAGLTDEASREFRDWLSSGFSRLWSSREEYRGAEIPLHAFLLRLPGSRKVAVGTVWGSHDQGGLRKFPFALFSLLAPGRAEATALSALDYLPVFEGRAREIRRKYEAGGSLSDVYQELRGARIEIPLRTPEQIRAELEESLSTPRVGSLARALFGGEAEERWPALLTGLDGAARRAGDGAGAFRFPLADEPAPIRQLQLWTLRMTRSSPEGMGPSGILYRTGGEVPSGVVFYRVLKPEDILLLHPAAAPTEFVEEIPPPVRRESPRVEPDSESAQVTPATPSPPPPETAAEGPELPSEPSPAPPVPASVSPAPVEAAPPADEAGRVQQPAAPEAPPAPPEAASEAPPTLETALPDATPPAPTPPEPVPAEPPGPPAEPAPLGEPKGWERPLSTLLARD